MIKVIYHSIPAGFVAAVVTNTGDRIQAPRNYNSIWEIFDLAASFGAQMERR